MENKEVEKHLSSEHIESSTFFDILEVELNDIIKIIFKLALSFKNVMELRTVNKKWMNMITLDHVLDIFLQNSIEDYNQKNKLLVEQPKIKFNGSYVDFLLTGETVFTATIKAPNLNNSKLKFDLIYSLIENKNVIDDLKKANRFGETPLSIACLAGNKILVTNILNMLGVGCLLIPEVFTVRYPLHNAVISGNIDLVEFLLVGKRLKYCINVMDSYSKTPMSYVSDNKKMLELLHQHGGGLSTNKAAYCGSMVYIKCNKISLLEEEFLDKSCQDENFFVKPSYCMDTAHMGTLEFDKNKIENLVGIDLQSEFSLGNFLTLDGVYQDTQLHSAVNNNEVNLLDKLIQKLPPKNVCPALKTSRYTPLHLAAAQNKKSCLELIVNALKKIEDSEIVTKILDRKDFCGNTALMLAVRYDIGEFDIVKILIDAGASIDLSNEFGKTTIDQACPRVKDYLLNKKQNSKDSCKNKIFIEDASLVHKQNNIEDNAEIVSLTNAQCFSSPISQPNHTSTTEEIQLEAAKQASLSVLNPLEAANHTIRESANENCLAAGIQNSLSK